MSSIVLYALYNLYGSRGHTREFKKAIGLGHAVDTMAVGQLACVARILI